MKYIKSYKLFETINTENFHPTSKSNLETMAYILKELDSSYYDISINSVSCRDGSIIFFNALAETIKKHENYPYFEESFGDRPLDKIGEIITVRIYLEKDEFKWDDVKTVVTETVSFMQDEGWRYIVQPVMSITYNYSLKDMDMFSKGREKPLKTLCLIFYNDFV